MNDKDKPSRGPDPGRRRPAAIRSGIRLQGSGIGRAEATADEEDAGRSGYGSESVRPYLRAQLRQKELMSGPQLGWEGSRRRPKP
ncbi:hypothetical protein [Ramlibacter sp.]|uniref:hypothetical protein n=1 Tax=Ramlibacter sp. TaxID=1917967 RepID=UPI003D13B252